MAWPKMADGSEYVRAIELEDLLGPGKSIEHVTGLQSDFAARLRSLLSSAPPELRADLGIFSGYRSPERQAQLFGAAVKRYGSTRAARKWVAPPGVSFHGKGLATDLSYRGQSLARAPKDVVDWIHTNAPKHGLYFPLNHENWHIEPIGSRPGNANNKKATKVLQADLARRGAQIEVDGEWGPKTEQAFREIGAPSRVFPAGSFEREPRAKALAPGGPGYGAQRAVPQPSIEIGSNTFTDTPDPVGRAILSVPGAVDQFTRRLSDMARVDQAPPRPPVDIPMPARPITPTPQRPDTTIAVRPEFPGSFPIAQPRSPIDERNELVDELTRRNFMAGQYRDYQNPPSATATPRAEASRAAMREPVGGRANADLVQQFKADVRSNPRAAVEIVRSQPARPVTPTPERPTPTVATRPEFPGSMPAARAPMREPAGGASLADQFRADVRANPQAAAAVVRQMPARPVTPTPPAMPPERPAQPTPMPAARPAPAQTTIAARPEFPGALPARQPTPAQPARPAPNLASADFSITAAQAPNRTTIDYRADLPAIRPQVAQQAPAAPAAMPAPAPAPVRPAASVSSPPQSALVPRPFQQPAAPSAPQPPRTLRAPDMSTVAPTLPRSATRDNSARVGRGVLSGAFSGLGVAGLPGAAVGAVVGGVNAARKQPFETFAQNIGNPQPTLLSTLGQMGSTIPGQVGRDIGYIGTKSPELADKYGWYGAGRNFNNMSEGEQRIAEAAVSQGYLNPRSIGWNFGPASSASPAAPSRAAPTRSTTARGR